MRDAVFLYQFLKVRQGQFVVVVDVPFLFDNKIPETDFPSGLKTQFFI